MKRLIAVTCLILVLAIAAPALAADVIVSSKVERITEKTTKAGDTYSIVFIKETRTLEGIEYTVDVPMYAFGEAGAKVRSLKPGDPLKAVVAKSERGGNVRYTVHAVVQ